MINLNIPAGDKTPAIKADFDSGIIEISGRSIPENSIDFYKPLLDELIKFVDKPNLKAELHVYLDYFNTSSSKCLLDVFKVFDQIHLKNNNSVIIWKYDENDEDMLEAGQDYESILKVPFQFMEVKE